LPLERLDLTPTVATPFEGYFCGPRLTVEPGPTVPEKDRPIALGGNRFSILRRQRHRYHSSAEQHQPNRHGIQ